MKRGDWCILRTSGPKTLALARSLAEAGYEVWTPKKVLDRKRSKKRDAPEVQIAITPTFVFARSAHITDLAVARNLDTSPHPAFSIFRFAGRYPLIADIEIRGFRAAEEAANLERRKTRHAKVEQGQRVKFDEGPYAVLNSGTVKSVGGKESVVIFEGRELKIATWLLSENVVAADSSPLGSAARAA